MSNNFEQHYFIGVDVGTSSVRSVVIDNKGHLCGSAIVQLLINSYNHSQGYFEQSSDQIWEASCTSIRHVLKQCHLNSDEVAGIGFDATCSLVVLDDHAKPLSVNPTSSDDKWNVIMWMDHRASKQAYEINAYKHSCLKSVGDKISLEMEPPKLLWLKQNMPHSYQKAGSFMDLADFLTFKATGSLSRSSCCVVCKWMYQANGEDHSWDPSFYKQIGLSDLCDNDFGKIGNLISKPGTACGSGLNSVAAEKLGLKAGIPVATGIIDAHAGCLGMLYTKVDDKTIKNLPVTSKLSMICGTSTCHMALSHEPLHVSGVWGPYFDVILPNYWINEAGQSAIGPVLDAVVRQFGSALKTNGTEMTTTDLHTLIRQKLADYEDQNGHLQTTELTKDIHVWPDYHGNRSPLAESRMTGAIMGLRLESDQDTDSYAMSIYLAHIHSFALMTRFIIETLTNKGHNFEAIYLCGGLQKNSFYVQAHADACQLPVVVPDDMEPVARGAAILGAYASGKFDSLEEAANSLAPQGKIVRPNLDTKDFFDRKYLIFRQLGNLMLQTIIDDAECY